MLIVNVKGSHFKSFYLVSRHRIIIVLIKNSWNFIKKMHSKYFSLMEIKIKSKYVQNIHLFTVKPNGKTVIGFETWKKCMMRIIFKESNLYISSAMRSYFKPNIHWTGLINPKKKGRIEKKKNQLLWKYKRIYMSALFVSMFHFIWSLPLSSFIRYQVSMCALHNFTLINKTLSKNWTFHRNGTSEKKIVCGWFPVRLVHQQITYRLSF